MNSISTTFILPNLSDKAPQISLPAALNRAIIATTLAAVPASNPASSLKIFSKMYHKNSMSSMLKFFYVL